MNTIDDFKNLRLPPGWRIERHSQVDSTNTIAKNRALAGAAEMLAVLADEQIAGRGRMGRAWIAPPGSSLLVSLLVRPALAVRDAFLLTMATTSALCDAIERVAPVRAALKWPNDLLLACPDGRLRKAAGILTEVEFRDGVLAWAVIGIGVNVAWHPAGQVDGRDLAESATSLAAAGGGQIGRAQLLTTLLAELSERLAWLDDERRETIAAMWRERLVTIGAEVAVHLPGQVLHGVAEGVEERGALLVRDAEGILHRITAGDVDA